MENRFQRILLSAICAPILLAGSSFASFANDDVNVKADVERRQVFDDVLDTENWEVGIKAGLMSIEDFESSLWVSAHLGYHITDSFYVKARYAQAKAGETSFEKLTNTAPLLTDKERELSYYGLNLGYNFFPGEIFFSKNTVYNSVFSIELGGGSTDFAGDDQFTVDITANYRVFFTDWIAWDISMSDYLFNTEVTGSSKTTHNLTFATGVAFYF
ncbi:outer membrane beta-barrel domain-containing protein [Shewanella maritima]|uniref:outer membrane beta-barrel domain-containing protein n=1 Tax=Shewanella maritima TaxID=2520507 RepID=UPI003735B727